MKPVFWLFIVSVSCISLQILVQWQIYYNKSDSSGPNHNTSAKRAVFNQLQNINQDENITEDVNIQKTENVQDNKKVWNGFMTTCTGTEDFLSTTVLEDLQYTIQISL